MEDFWSSEVSVPAGGVPHVGWTNYVATIDFYYFCQAQHQLAISIEIELN
jgi:hypothetical protein